MTQEDRILLKKSIDKAIKNTYNVKQNALAEHLINNYTDMITLVNVAKFLEYVNQEGYTKDLVNHLTAPAMMNSKYAHEIIDVLIEYGKNGHELIPMLTPVSEMTPDQLDFYIVKMKENIALKGEKSDEEICGEMLSVFAETGTTLNYDEAKHISSSLKMYPTLNDAQFTIGLINGNYYMMSKGTDSIALPTERPAEINRDTFMCIAERALTRAGNSREDLSTTTLTDMQIRRRLTAYTFVAMKYQGIAREIGEKELLPEIEEKKPINEPQQYPSLYDEMIEENNRLVLERMNREQLEKEEDDYMCR